MRALLLAVALVAMPIAVPSAEAHECAGQDYLTTCGPCKEGEAHSHADTRSGEACTSQKKASPAPAAALAVLGIAAVALVRRRG